MDARSVKDISLRVRSLTKAVDEKQPISNIIAILESLQKDVVPTEELLRSLRLCSRDITDISVVQSTRVGVAVNKQKSHPDKAVALLASRIVSKWKSDMNVRGSAKAKKAASRSPPKEEAGAKSSVPPLERNKDKDGVDCKRTGDTIPPALVLKRAIDIERAAFVNHGATSTEYKNKIRSLYQNLKHKSNPQLRVHVLSAEITAERLVVMTHKELASPERRAEDEKMQQENMNKAMVAQGEKSVSTALKCPKCGQKKVSYSQAQTRSADEPMTTFCECTICGNRWKFS
ncbi:MAG: RNA polymerase II elongation factor [Trichoglossum hirsutum]|nr:MAG: RNA polymerase II elongation factor [Trichoglossum hirsutum]